MTGILPSNQLTAVSGSLWPITSSYTSSSYWWKPVDTSAAKINFDKAISRIFTRDIPGGPLFPDQYELINLLNMVISTDIGTVKTAHNIIHKLGPHEYIYVIAFTSIYADRLNGSSATIEGLDAMPQYSYDAFVKYEKSLGYSTIEAAADSVLNILQDYIEPNERRLEVLEILVNKTSLYKKFRPSYIDHTLIKFNRNVT